MTSTKCTSRGRPSKQPPPLLTTPSAPTLQPMLSGGAPTLVPASTIASTSPVAASTRSEDTATAAETISLDVTPSVLPTPHVPLGPDASLEVPSAPETSALSEEELAPADTLTPDELFFVTEAEAADNARRAGEAGVVEAEGIGYTDASPVALSLLNAMDPELIAGRQLLATLDYRRPQVTSNTQDNAKYWLTSSGEVLVVRLPCLVDTSMQGVKTGKYFDLYGEEITDDKFKKLRAVFGFRSLPDDGDEYPLEVLKAASAAQKLLCKLQSKNEAEAADRNQRASNIKGFYKADTAQDCFQYLIRSEPIFTPACDPAGGASGVSVIDLTGDTDSDSASDLIFSSPSKLRARAASRSTASKTPHVAAPSYTLGDWAQPAHSSTRYYHLVGDRTHLWASQFNIPEIRNQSGAIVHPTEWGAALVHLTPITVDFVLKLWDIPTGRGCEGSRIYQLVLRKIQIHPANSLSSCVVGPLFGKGKKRAASIDMESENFDDGVGPSSPTKKAKSRARAGDEDFVMGI